MKHTARKSFTLNARDLHDSWRQAIGAGQSEMLWLVEFAEPPMVAEIRVRPGRLG